MLNKLNKELYLIPCFCIFLQLGVFIPVLYAFDWKKLHDQADSLDSSSASELVQKEGKSPESLYLLALTYLSEHKDREAQEIFGQLATRFPEAPGFMWGQAEVLRRNHELAPSERILSRLIEQYPGFAPAYISLAYLKHTNMDFKTSVKLASQVLALGRDKVDVSNFARAYLLIAGGKGMLSYYGGPLAKMINGPTILPTLKKAQRLQPKSAVVLFGLGSFYFLAPRFVGGDFNKAISYLEQAVHTDPLLADAYVRLAEAYNMKGDSKRYNTFVAQALAIDPKNTLALDAQTRACKFICKSPED